MTLEGAVLLLDDSVIAVVEELLTPLVGFVGGLEGADFTWIRPSSGSRRANYRIAALAQRAHQHI